MSPLNPVMFLQQPRLDKHPFVLLALNYVVVGLCVNIVPATTRARAAAVLAFVALQLFFFHHVKLNKVKPSYQAFWAYTVFAQILYSTHFIYILRISPPRAADTWWKKARWAWRELINPRGIGAAWQIKNMPAFEGGGTTWSGSRVQFVAMRLCGFVMKHYSSIAFGELTRLLRLKNGDFMASKIPLLTRLSEVNGRELVVRLYIPFKIWASMYFDHSAMHSLISAIAVACGDDPSSWPPMYGNLSEVYLVRRFFGFFWQRLIYKGFTANASLITANVFRIPRGSEAGKWMVTFLSFLLSGLLHVVAFKMVMFTRNPMPIFKWWLQTGVTILFEDLVIKGYVYLGSGGRTKTKWWWRGLGYCSSQRIHVSPLPCITGEIGCEQKVEADNRDCDYRNKNEHPERERSYISCVYNKGIYTRKDIAIIHNGVLNIRILLASLPASLSSSLSTSLSNSLSTSLSSSSSPSSSLTSLTGSSLTPSISSSPSSSTSLAGSLPASSPSPQASPGAVIPTNLLAPQAGGFQVVVSQKPAKNSSEVSGTTGIQLVSGLGNSVDIIEGNIPYMNSLIHITNGFFTIHSSLSSTIQSNGLTTLGTLLSSANLTNTLDAANSVTVFTPNNAAFLAAFNSTSSMNNTAILPNLLSNHVIPNFLGYMPNLKDGASYTTLAGETLTITVRNGDYFVNGAKIISANNILTNGVAHVIDKVLVPTPNLIFTGGSGHSIRDNTIIAAVSATVLAILMARTML